jgi:polar amino acid transport system substrate-binding protein
MILPKPLNIPTDLFYAIQFLCHSSESRNPFLRMSEHILKHGNKGKTLWAFIFAILAFFICSGFSSAKEIKIAIGFAVAPYVLPETASGIEVEIIRESLKAKGRQANFSYVPNLRIPMHLKYKKVEAAAANASYDIGKDAGIPMYCSEPTVTMKNYAIALAKKQFEIHSIKDLADKAVIAFQNAAKYLGPEFASMAEKNEGYEERAKQSLQVSLLFAERTDVAVADKRIFLYWRDHFPQVGIDFAQPLKFYPIFPEAPRHCAFIDKALRDEFNEGLKIIRENGIYDRILKKYENYSSEK